MNSIPEMPNEIPKTTDEIRALIRAELAPALDERDQRLLSEIRKMLEESTAKYLVDTDVVRIVTVEIERRFSNLERKVEDSTTTVKALARNIDTQFDAIMKEQGRLEHRIERIESNHDELDKRVDANKELSEAANRAVKDFRDDMIGDGTNSKLAPKSIIGILNETIVELHEHVTQTAEETRKTVNASFTEVASNLEKRYMEDIALVEAHLKRVEETQTTHAQTLAAVQEDNATIARIAQIARFVFTRRTAVIVGGAAPIATGVIAFVVEMLKSLHVIQ